MRIAISGTANIGKTTLIQDFLKTWPNYKTPSQTYREALKAGNYPHSKKCTKDGQWAILNHMIDEMQKYTSKDHVIFDRCPLDNLIYSLWSNSKNATDVDDEFVNKCINVVRESMKFLDIIFFIPITKASQVKIEENGMREIDPEYISEIDNLFKAIIRHYTHGLTVDKFFPKDDSPGIIEIYGNREERIALMNQYLNVDGDIIGEAGDTVLNPHTINQLEQLLKDQAASLTSEKSEQHQRQLIADFTKTGKLNKS